MTNLYEDKNTRAYFGLDRYDSDDELSDLIREAIENDREFWEDLKREIESDDELSDLIREAIENDREFWEDLKREIESYIERK